MKIKYIILLATILSLISIVALFFILRDDRLEKAKAWASIGEFEKSVEIYQQYLLDHSEDLESKLEYANLLYKTGDYSKESSVLDTLEEEVRKVGMKDLKRVYWARRVCWARIELLSGLAGLAEDRGSKHMLAGEFVEAREEYESAYSFQLESQSVKRVWINKLPYSGDTPGSIGISYAYVCWILLDNRKCRDILSLDTSAHIGFARRINDYASRQFDNKKFEEAERGFKDSWEIYTNYSRHSWLDPSVDEIAGTKYNLGVSLFNQKKYAQAANVFRELKRDVPQFEPAKISEMLESLSRSNN